MILHIIRVLYVLVVLAFTISYVGRYRIHEYENGATYATLYILIPALAAFALVLLDMFWRRKPLQALSGLFLGLLAGLVIAYVLAQVIDLAGILFGQVPEAPAIVEAPAKQAAEPIPGVERIVQAPPLSSFLALAKVLLGASVVFICVSFVLQTKDDFRFIVPYVEFSRQAKGRRPLRLDTSVIIDGRIADIAETRILDAEVLVPRFVLSELQGVADSQDKLRRNRGRRGLEVLNRLQSSSNLDIRMTGAEPPNIDPSRPVDAKLVALAEHLSARILTNDYNLGRIAQLRGVDVVNVNDLANALKPIVLPGETLTVKIVRPGEEPGQGVGYLDDGTMVVAEQGRDHLGKEITITVTSVLQTSAGRMIFGKTDQAKNGQNRRRNKH